MTFSSFTAFLPSSIAIRTCVRRFTWLIFQLERGFFRLVCIIEFLLKDFLHQITHEQVDVNVFHCRCLVISHVVLICHFSSLLLTNFTIIYHINFVTHENHRHVVISVLLEALHPHLYVFERCYIGYVKSKDDTLSLFIEGLC